MADLYGFDVYQDYLHEHGTVVADRYEHRYQVHLRRLAIPVGLDSEAARIAKDEIDRELAATERENDWTPIKGLADVLPAIRQDWLWRRRLTDRLKTRARWQGLKLRKARHLDLYVVTAAGYEVWAGTFEAACMRFIGEHEQAAILRAYLEDKSEDILVAPITIAQRASESKPLVSPRAWTFFAPNGGDA